MADTTCAICCNDYNRSKNVKVTCSYCHKSVCRDCGQRYTLDQAEPVCIHPDCKQPWNREFVDSNFTKHFRDGDLKRKREDVLLSREEALLPDTQDLAALEKERQLRIKEKKDLAAKLAALKRQVEETKAEMYRKDREIWNLQNQVAHGLATGNVANAAPGERRQFIKHCPVDNCNGFLTTQYNCGLCRVKVCSKCLVPKGENPDEHVCDPDTVASVEFLMKDTRPCPKCATPIHKIDGCDQMWCTQCQTAFSWRTGRVETGRVHNPHWYEWQRRVNNGQIPREPGDNPAGQCCAGGDRDLPRLSVIPAHKRTDLLSRIHRQLTHISLVVLPTYQGEFRVQDNRDLRIKYLLGEVDKAKWKKTLQQREKKRLKEQALRQALEVLIHGSVDIFHRLVQDRAYDWARAEPELEALRQYTNGCLKDVCKRFSTTYVMDINTGWAVSK